MLNKVLLIGNLTREPVSRIVGQNNTAVTTFTIAVNRMYKNQKETDFLDVECWGKTAENVSAYMQKGSKVLVEGSLKVDKWDDKTTGEKRSKVVVKADRVGFVTPKKGEAPAEEATDDTPNDVPDDDVPF